MPDPNTVPHLDNCGICREPLGKLHAAILHRLKSPDDKLRQSRPLAVCVLCDEAGKLAMDRAAQVVHEPKRIYPNVARVYSSHITRRTIYPGTDIAVLRQGREPFLCTVLELIKDGPLPDDPFKALRLDNGETLPLSWINGLETVSLVGKPGETTASEYGDDMNQRSRDGQRAFRKLKELVEKNGGDQVMRNLATGQPVCADLSAPAPAPPVDPAVAACSNCNAQDPANAHRHKIVYGFTGHALCVGCSSAYWNGAYRAGNIRNQDDLTMRVINERRVEAGYEWDVPLVEGSWYIFTGQMAPGGQADRLLSWTDHKDGADPSHVRLHFAGEKAAHAQRMKETKMAYEHGRREAQNYREMHGPFQTEGAARTALEVCRQRDPESWMARATAGAS